MWKTIGLITLWIVLLVVAIVGFITYSNGLGFWLDLLIFLAIGMGIIALIVYTIMKLHEWRERREEIARLRLSIQEPPAQTPQSQSGDTAPPDSPTITAQQPTSEPPRRGWKLFWSNWFNRIALILNAIILFTSFTLIVFGRVFSSSRWTILGVTLLLLQLIYTLVSTKSVVIGEQAVLLFFGRCVKDVKPGIVYVPLWLCSLVIFPTTNVEDELPANPEDIYHGDPVRDRDGTIPEGKVPPIRVTFRAATGKEDFKVRIELPNKPPIEKDIPEDDPLRLRLTVDVAMPFSWRIYNLKLFVETVGTFERAHDLIDDTAVGVFTDIFSRMTVAEALMSLEMVSNKVKEALEALVEPWGATITMVKFRPFGLSHNLNESIDKVPQAEQNAQSTITDARAKGEKLTLEGKGAGNAEKAIRIGKAEGNAAIAEVAKTTEGQIALTLDALQTAASYRNFAVVNQNDLIGGILGGREIWNRLGGNLPPTPTTLTSPTTPNAPSTPVELTVQPKDRVTTQAQYQTPSTPTGKQQTPGGRRRKKRGKR